MRQFLLNSSIISSILAVSPLVQLTEDNFESTLEQYDDILINFYSPWATNWKSMQPHFEAVAPVMAASKPSYFVGVVNCNIEKVLCYRYTDTSGYPDPVLLNFNRRTAEQKIEANKTNAELREKYEAEQLAKQEEALVIDAQTGEPVEDETKNKPDQETDPEKIAENARVKQAKLDRDMKLLHLDYDIQKYTGGKIGILMYQTLMGDRKKVNEITSVEEFRKLTSQQLVNVAIAFLDGSKQEKAPGFKALHMAADQLSTEKYFQIVKTRIYYTFDAEVIKAAGLRKGCQSRRTAISGNQDF